MIYRNKSEASKFSVVSRAIFEDTRLSFRAKGILAYLLGFPHDWDVYQCHVAKHAKEGRDAIASAIKELIATGYVVQQRVQGKDGRFEGWRYDVFDIPQSTDSGFSEIGFPGINKEDCNKKEEMGEKEEMDAPSIGACGRRKSKAPEPIPSIEDVLAEGNSRQIPVAICRRFFCLNEFNGWHTVSRHSNHTCPILYWRAALVAFADADNKRTLRGDRTSNDEFWAWAIKEFDEDDRCYVRDWVATNKRSGYKRLNPMNGEMEPIRDFRKACRAFVEFCRSQKVCSRHG